MAQDLIHDISPAALKARLAPLIAANPQPLPLSAKQFLAVASLQDFDGQPETAEPAQMDILIAGGYLELNRGLAPSAGLTARFYAEQVYTGPMFPGAVKVYGHGMYFSEPSHPTPTHKSFPRMSAVAVEYATKGGQTGVLLRGGLNPEARRIDLADLREQFRSDKNRVQRAGIEDLGTYAAALGIEVIAIPKPFLYTDEQTWLVLNRTAMILQDKATQLSQKV